MAERVTRDLSQLVQPHKTTVLLEPQPRPCRDQQDLKLVVAVFSAPRNYLTRAVVRETWAPALRQFPGVELVFFLGRDPDQQLHVRFLVAIRNSSKSYSRYSLTQSVSHSVTICELQLYVINILYMRNKYFLYNSTIIND